MAAYASLVSLEHVLDQILDHAEDSVTLHDDDEIKSLHRNVISLVAFLEDFPEYASTFLEGRIRNAANQAEDIIEHRISDEMLCEIIEDTGFNKLRRWQRLSEELQGVTTDVKTIVEEVMQIKSSREAKNSISCRIPASSSSSSSRLGSSGKDTPVGLEQDLSEIKHKLCGEPSRLRIITITGMGGIGKTTLARYAYDEPLFAYHFDVRAWVNISQVYDMKQILLGILQSLDASCKESFDLVAEEKLLGQLYKSLKGRRYLIVLDDVWDARLWDALGRIFPDDSNGSRIMITSRDLDVASYIDPSSHPHEMTLMDVDKSWKLLREKVFAQEHCPSQLGKIGKFIAEKCQGLPLAIVVIAGILKANPMQETWESVARNVNEAVNTSDEKFTEILSLSYEHLPHHLRPCFLYMGGFPKDCKISISELVKLWAAEGFLKSNRSKNLEEVAEVYLKDLTKRSLVMVNRKRCDGKIKAVKIHDLLRDLCLRKAQDEKFLQVTDKVSDGLLDGTLNSRRLSISAGVLGDFLDINDSPIRTILLPLGGWEFNTWRCFKLLRILDASTLNVTSFHTEIGELFHLRYLAFYAMHEGEFKVSSSLSRLQNLQTLIVMPHGFRVRLNRVLLQLPFGLWRLSQLRHLILFDMCLPDPSAGALTTIETLRTLSRVTSFTCSERILKLVPNLRKLEIIYPHGDISHTVWSKHRLNYLVHFHVLEKLNLEVGRGRWEYYFPWYGYPAMQKFDITFPVTLKRLTLSGCRFSWQDMTIIGSLPNLEVLKLRDDAFCGDYWETSEGEFSRLKVLLMERADPLHWVTESPHFPRLQRLLLHDCRKLSEIPCCIGDIPTLELMELLYCNASMEASAKRIEEEQRELGNDDLQVRI